MGDWSLILSIITCLDLNITVGYALVKNHNNELLTMLSSNGSSCL